MIELIEKLLGFLTSIVGLVTAIIVLKTKK